MTKKDFERAASIVRAHLSVGTTRSYKEATLVAQAFVSFFRSDNPRFDEMRFLVACELAGEAE